MTDNMNQAVKKKTVKHKSKQKPSKRRGSNILLYISLITVFVAVVIILSLTVFFNVETITVKTKSSNYTNEQIISMSGLSIGNNLWLTNTKQAEEIIKTQLPYIGEVTVKKRFPSTFEITVKDVKPNRVYIWGGKFALAYNEKILKMVDEYNGNYLVYDIPIKDASVGLPVTLEEDISEVYTKLNKSVSESKLDKINVIRFSNAVDIKLIYDNRLLLDIGTTENLNTKLKNAVEVIKKVNQKHGEDAEGTINLKYLVDGNDDSYFTLESIEQYKLSFQQ